MNSLERIAAAVAFQATDRVPVIAQVFGHAATLAGVALDDYALGRRNGCRLPIGCLDARLMTPCSP